MAQKMQNVDILNFVKKSLRNFAKNSTSFAVKYLFEYLSEWAQCSNFQMFKFSNVQVFNPEGFPYPSPDF